MSLFWGDVNARARGLGTRLLNRPALERLAGAAGMRGVADGLAARGFPVPGEEPGRRRPEVLEAVVRRLAGDRTALLLRWLGPRAEVVRVLFEAEERRSVRALLRGAAAGAPPAERTAGLVPTPALPASALEDLARARDPTGVVEGLLARDHPFGEALRGGGDGEAPGLLEAERRLAAAFAARAVSAVPRREPGLRRFVERTVDLENAWTALLWDGAPEEPPAEGFFLEGGRVLDRERFRGILSGESSEERRSVLARAFGETPLGRAFGRSVPDPGALEGPALRARIREERAAALREPLGPAPLLLYALRLRAEAFDLRRIVWGVALGAPSAEVGAELVT